MFKGQFRGSMVVEAWAVVRAAVWVSGRTSLDVVVASCGISSSVEISSFGMSSGEDIGVFLCWTVWRCVLELSLLRKVVVRQSL